MCIMKEKHLPEQNTLLFLLHILANEECVPDALLAVRAASKSGYAPINKCDFWLP